IPPDAVFPTGTSDADASVRGRGRRGLRRLANDSARSEIEEFAMSYLLKAVAIFAAISLGIVASQILPGGAEDKPDQAAQKPEAAPAEERAESPPPARPRSGDLPLSHAILRDEKDDDSAEARIIRTLAKPTTVEFLDLPLEDCITFLKEYHN